MKQLVSILAIALAPVLVFAQASLPTSWNGEGGAPTGWMTNGTGNYSQGQSGAGIKMNGTGQFVQINFADEAGELSYYLKGQTFEGAAFQGTFTIEESVNGSSWSTLRVLSGTDFNINAFNYYTDQPSADSRYVRFYFTQKVSGSNINLDEIAIALPAAGAEAEINLSFNGEPIINGKSIAFAGDVNSDNAISISVENAGTTEALTMSNFQLSGDDAVVFSVTTSPSSIAGLQTDDIVLNFHPTQAGTHRATLTFDNNDANENPGVIELIGYGDGLASEPISSPSALTESIVKSYRIVAAFTPSNDAEGHLIVLQENNMSADAPMDGVNYKVGDVIGNSKVIAKGDISSFTIKNVLASTDYSVSVFAYNGVADFTNYNSNPAYATITSEATMMPTGEYDNIDRTQPSFVTDLHNQVFPHFQIFYSNYDETYIRKFAARDTTQGRKVINCVYSNDEYLYTEPFTFDYMSREHTYSFSWMPHADQEAVSYSDVHNLYPVNQDDANAIRSNYPLGIVQNITSTFKGAKFGTNAKGQKVYEPRDAHKGDAARAMFYMAIAYHGDQGQDWSLPTWIGPFTPYGQDQDLLKEWHFNDLPDGKDIARNDFIDSLQGNRNPFVDMPELVCGIDFRDMSWVNEQAPCTNTSTLELNEIELSSYHYDNALVLNLNGSLIEDAAIQIYDAQGKLVKAKNQFLVNGNNNVSTAHLSTGLYVVNIQTNHKAFSFKFVK